jgi:hypothetical protein
MPKQGYVHPSKQKNEPSTDQIQGLQDTAAIGVKAELILREVGDKLDTRREQIIGHGLAAYRTMQMDEKMALRFWACLNEVAALKEQLTHEVDVGVAAYEKLMEGTSNE